MSKLDPRLLTGVFPIAPTPFTDAGDLDLEGMRRVLDCMIDQQVSGICILANYSEQFLLSDAERDSLLKLCLEHVAGRVPVIVTTSHFSTRLAIQRAKAAASAGAAMLMMMPPYHGASLKADERGMIEHFQRVADAALLPIMVQDAPLSGVTLSVPFLARLAREVPLVTHFKIVVPGTSILKCVTNGTACANRVRNGTLSDTPDSGASCTMIGSFEALATAAKCSSMASSSACNAAP